MIALACALLAAQTLLSVSGWNFNSSLLRVAIYWGAMTSYEFFILLFTLIRPRWLTSMIAAILILPLLSASIFLPLDVLFDRSPRHIQVLGGPISIETVPWDSVLHGTSGVDAEIIQTSSRVPFMRRHLGGVRFYSKQCNTTALVITLAPDHRSIFFHCPNGLADGGNTSQFVLP
jgi:hypothetical protein